MGIAMNKEVLVRVPEGLYVKVKKLCGKEYKSISALIRELLLERINDSLTSKESAMLARSRQEFKEGKGVAWRKVKRG